jgi:hypothetical protein
VRVQSLVISSEKVGWQKQGMCMLVDDEPVPPRDVEFAADKGWKEVKSFRADIGGGNFLFPRDQILLVMRDGSYAPIETDTKRTLGNINQGRNYLVWYHHLMQTKDWAAKYNAWVAANDMD